eukprot:705970-Amphidinium_carterae.1
MMSFGPHCFAGFHEVTKSLFAMGCGLPSVLAVPMQTSATPTTKSAPEVGSAIIVDKHRTPSSECWCTVGKGMEHLDQRSGPKLAQSILQHSDVVCGQRLTTVPHSTHSTHYQFRPGEANQHHTRDTVQSSPHAASHSVNLETPIVVDHVQNDVSIDSKQQ